MIQSTGDLVSSNPFASRYIVPGSMEFYFSGSCTIDELVERISVLPTEHRSERPGFAIVGPHGTGKSTLLSQLAKRLSVASVTLHTSTGRIAGLQAVFRNVHHQRFSLVDGFEQLPWWTQRLAIAYARIRGSTLCVTSHMLPAGFELLWQTGMDSRIERHVVDQLLQGRQAHWGSTLLASDAWNQSREKHGQNLRETLFDMYDWWRDTVDEHSLAR